MDRILSDRVIIAAIPSPMCPMISLSLGCRSSVPARTSRNTWMAVSECQPHAAVDNRKPV